MFAQQHDVSMVFETSAKTNYGMDDMIYELALEIDKKKAQFEPLFEQRSGSIDLKGNNQKVNRANRNSLSGSKNKD